MSKAYNLMIQFGIQVDHTSRGEQAHQDDGPAEQPPDEPAHGRLGAGPRPHVPLLLEGDDTVHDPPVH